ncbi:MAG TPA: DUF5667 domain-containing protein [Aggregatilineales bacterium]|nr:DUF5667 domain-containing protein [Aggregatilineales bacterium]
MSEPVAGSNERDITLILSQCLEQIERGAVTPDQCIALYRATPELSDLLGAALALRDVPRPELSDLARSAARQRMLAHYAQRATTPTQSGKTWRGALQQTLRNQRRSVTLHRLRVRAAALALVVFLLASIGGQQLVFASQDSLPGDPLYNLKRSFEQAEVSLTSPTYKASLLQQVAETRLREVALLTSKGQMLPDSLVLDTIQSVEMALLAQSNPAARALFAAQATFTVENAESSGVLDGNRGSAFVTVIGALTNVQIIPRSATNNQQGISE